MHRFVGEGGHKLLAAQLPQSQGVFCRRAAAVGSGFLSPWALACQVLGVNPSRQLGITQLLNPLPQGDSGGENLKGKSGKTCGLSSDRLVGKARATRLSKAEERTPSLPSCSANQTCLLEKHSASGGTEGVDWGTDSEIELFPILVERERKNVNVAIVCTKLNAYLHKEIPGKQTGLRASEILKWLCSNS